MNRLSENPGVLSVTIYPAMPKLTGKARTAAKNAPGYTPTPITLWRRKEEGT